MGVRWGRAGIAGEIGRVLAIGASVRLSTWLEVENMGLDARSC